MKYIKNIIFINQNKYLVIYLHHQNNNDVKKVRGGRNGLGAKLTNIYNKKFILETADKKSDKIYKQIFTNNIVKNIKTRNKKI